LDKCKNQLKLCEQILKEKEKTIQDMEGNFNEKLHYELSCQALRFNKERDESENLLETRVRDREQTLRERNQLLTEKDQLIKELRHRIESF
jgi:hypothetical protein